MIVAKRISMIRVLKIIWKRLLMIVLLTVLTVVPMIYFELTKFAINHSIPLVFGTSIAIFLGFRTNSAYERWWEARKLWGSVVNDCFNLGRLARDLIGTETPIQFQTVKSICYRQAAWAMVLNRQLKGLDIDGGLDFLLDDLDRQVLKSMPDPAHYLLLQQSQAIRAALKNGSIDSFQSNLLQDAVSRLTNHMGGCHRIKNTNFPTHYSYFTKVFVWIFLLLLGFSLPSYHEFELVHQQAAGYVAIPAIVLIGWVFFMVEGIGEYMEAPFENNRNVIPMETLARKIEIDLRMILGETEFPPPLKPVDGVLW